MPRTKDKNRVPDRIVGLRFKPAEFALLEANMSALNYKSFTKYIKSCVLRRKGKPRPGSNPNKAVRTTMNQISERIARIGVNYNQAVRQINALAGKTRRNGDPVINTRFLTTYLDQLQSATEKLVETHNDLVKTVGLLLPDEDKQP